MFDDFVSASKKVHGHGVSGRRLRSTSGAGRLRSEGSRRRVTCKTPDAFQNRRRSSQRPSEQNIKFGKIVIDRLETDSQTSRAND